MNTGTVLILVALVLSFVSLYFLAKGAAGNAMAQITARRAGGAPLNIRGGNRGCAVPIRKFA